MDDKILTVGRLKEIIQGLDDDFNIELRVRRKATDSELKHMGYPYPWITEYVELQFDDIGYSDKDLCLGCEVSDDFVKLYNVEPTTKQ